MWILLSAATIALLVMVGATQAEGFSPSVHADHIDAATSTTLRCSADCQELMARVQELADDRFSGDKTDGRLYLHYVRPKRGYPADVHRKILTELGLSGEHAGLDAFVELSERRAFAHIDAYLRRAPSLGEKEIGEVLYIVATLLHAYQDRKHLENNWTDRGARGIHSLGHVFLEAHHSYSDFFPSPALQDRSIARSRAFLRRFQRHLQASAAGRDVLAKIAVFKARGAAELYRPAAMDTVFPSYPTRNSGNEGKLSLRIGQKLGEGRLHPSGEVGWSHEFYTRSPLRVEVQAHLGVEMGDKNYSYGRLSVLGGLTLGLASAGITAKLGVAAADPSQSYWSIGPAVTLFDSAMWVELVQRREAGERALGVSAFIDVTSWVRQACGSD